MKQWQQLPLHLHSAQNFSQPLSQQYQPPLLWQPVLHPPPLSPSLHVLQAG